MMICPMTACSNKSPVIAGFPSFSFFLPFSFFLSLSLLQPHLFNFISSSPFSFHLFFSALYLFYFFSTLEYFTQYSPPLHHSSGLTLLLPDDQRIPLLSSLATSVSPSSRGCPLINHSSVLLHFFCLSFSLLWLSRFDLLHNLFRCACPSARTESNRHCPPDCRGNPFAPLFHHQEFLSACRRGLRTASLSI